MVSEFMVKWVGFRNWGFGHVVQVCRAGIGVSGLGRYAVPRAPSI